MGYHTLVLISIIIKDVYNDIKMVILIEMKYVLPIDWQYHAFYKLFWTENIFKNTSFSSDRHSSFMTLRTGGYKFIRIE